MKLKTFSFIAMENGFITNHLKMIEPLEGGITPKASNIVWHQASVDRDAISQERGHRSAILWFTGLSGSGKSTLANVLAGKEKYKVTEGSVTYQGKDLLDLTPEERACEGIFLSFQYPIAIPGVNNMYFLKAAVNAV